MPDYVQTIDLKALIADFQLGSEGAMTVTEAELLIDIIEGEVGGYLTSLGVSIPILELDSPYSYKFIRALVVQGVMGLVQASIHALSDDTEGSRESAFWRRYEQGLKRMVENGGASLFDALTAASASERNNVPTFGNQELNVDHYLLLRDLTILRHVDNDYAVSRLYRRKVGARSFDGGPLA